MLDIRTIYHEPGLEPYPRAQQIIDRFPGAELVEVPSHQDIPGLYGNEGNVSDWVRNKREVLVLGVEKSLTARRNGRSSDWIATSTSNGCAMACSYCYWTELLEQVDAGTNEATKRRLACEIIFLTHNAGLHEVNLCWHPNADTMP